MKIQEFLDRLKDHFPGANIEIRAVPHAAKSQRMVVKDSKFMCWIEGDWVEDEKVEEIFKSLRDK